MLQAKFHSNSIQLNVFKVRIEENFHAVTKRAHCVSVILNTGELPPSKYCFNEMLTLKLCYERDVIGLIYKISFPWVIDNALVQKIKWNLIMVDFTSNELCMKKQWMMCQCIATYTNCRISKFEYQGNILLSLFYKHKINY